MCSPRFFSYRPPLKTTGLLMTNSQYGNTGSLSNICPLKAQPSCGEKKEENEYNAIVSFYPKSN